MFLSEGLPLQVSRNKDGTINIKLGDFGLAMEVKQPIFTVCGTPTYVAPEILTETGAVFCVFIFLSSSTKFSQTACFCRPTHFLLVSLCEKRYCLTGYGLEVDMWATGVIMYILLCGFPPFRSAERNQSELFEFIKAGQFEFLRPYWDPISKCKFLCVPHCPVSPSPLNQLKPERLRITSSGHSCAQVVPIYLNLFLFIESLLCF